MAQLTLYWSKCVTLIFDQWRTETWMGYLLSLLVCFLSVIFFHYLRDHRRRLQALNSFNPLPKNSDTASPPHIVNIERNRAVRVVCSAIVGINTTVAYLLMLAFLSANAGVILAIIAGYTVGHYTFRSPVNKAERAKISGVDNQSTRA